MTPAGPTRDESLVSVIIPCHNAEAWLGETLDSVAIQRDVACEVIVVDDGSTDASARVAESIGGRGIRVIRQEQQGVGAARNTGTAIARGAFLQYLDADDVLAPGAVRARVTALHTSGADVAYSDWVRWERQTDGTFEVGRFVTRKLGARPEIEMLRDAWWPPGALLYRRSFVDRIRSGDLGMLPVIVGLINMPVFMLFGILGVFAGYMGRRQHRVNIFTN